MPHLTGLEGVSEKEVECLYIWDTKAIETILLNGKAVAAAGDSGAINIWRDDKGVLRCVAMKHMGNLDKQEYDTYDEVRAWAKKWLKKIGV